MTDLELESLEAELGFIKAQQRIFELQGELERAEQQRDRLISDFINKRIWYLEQIIRQKEEEAKKNK